METPDPIQTDITDLVSNNKLVSNNQPETDLVLNKQSCKTNDSVFIAEHDTFDVIIKYYKDPVHNKLIVKDVHDTFDENAKNIKELIITFKHPSFKDFIEIYSELTKYTSTLETSSNLDMSIIQFLRAKTLIRKWNLINDINTFQDIDFSLIKAVFIHIASKIGFDGIA